MTAEKIINAQLSSSQNKPLSGFVKAKKNDLNPDSDQAFCGKTIRWFTDQLLEELVSCQQDAHELL